MLPDDATPPDAFAIYFSRCRCYAFDGYYAILHVSYDAA